MSASKCVHCGAMVEESARFPASSLGWCEPLDLTVQDWVHSGCPVIRGAIVLGKPCASFAPIRRTEFDERMAAVGIDTRETIGLCKGCGMRRDDHYEPGPAGGSA